MWLTKASTGPTSSRGINIMDEGKTKGESREAKRRKRRKMRVVGRSVRTLQEIIRQKAERARKNEGKAN